jgi:hypothetical protein
VAPTASSLTSNRFQSLEPKEADDMAFARYGAMRWTHLKVEVFGQRAESRMIWCHGKTPNL